MAVLNRLDKLQALQAEHIQLRSLLLRLFSQCERFRRKDMKKKQRVGLALEAGGALGAYEVGVVKALYQHYPHFQSNLRVVAGASSGAVNATVLVGAKGNPVQALEELWRERFAVNIPLMPELLYPLFLPLTGVPGMGHLRMDFLLNPFAALTAPSLFDNARVLQTVADLADEDRINSRSNPITLIVTATDVETGQLTQFQSHIQDAPFTFEMTRASGSIAPAFPTTTVTEQITHKEGRYWDGGFIASLPLSPVINVLERCDAGDDDVERVAIAVRVNPQRARLPRHLLEISDRFFDLLTFSKLELDRKMFEKTDARIELFQLLDQHLTEEDRRRILGNKRLREAYKEMKSHRKIRCIVIETTRPELFGAPNFSKSAIEDRIECGYEDTYKTLVEEGIIENVSEYEQIPTFAAEGMGTEEQKPLHHTE
jgi:NTE family protein